MLMTQRIADRAVDYWLGTFVKNVWNRIEFLRHGY